MKVGAQEMVDIQNLTGLEKPLTKLIETVSEGLGIVGNSLFQFDAKKIKRIGRAEAEQDKQKIIAKAEGEAQALGLLDRAGKRFALEQYNKQINLENIVVKSQELISKQEVSAVPVDKDWTARFLSIAQDVSKEEMQDVLAKILAGEVAHPSTYSLRTLATVKDLSAQELESFKKFVALSSPGNGLFVPGSINRETLQEYDLDFTDYIQLIEIALFNPSASLHFDMALKSGERLKLEAAGNLFTITTSDPQRHLKLTLIKFTEAGMQLASLLQDTSSNNLQQKYVEDLNNYIASEGFQVVQ